MTVFLSAAFVLVFGSLCYVCYTRNVAIKRLTNNLGQVYSNLESVRGDRDHHMAEAAKLKVDGDKKLQSVRKELEDRLHEKDARVQKIVDENSNIQWRRDRQREAYNVTISVNPELFGGRGFQRDDLIYIARYLGDQVAHEFASYKFVEKARDAEHEEHQARYRRPYTF